MLSQRVLSGVHNLSQHVLREFRRNIGVTAVAAQQTAKLDPIQQLFVQKIREYAEKSKSAGGKLVDTSPAVDSAYQKEIEKVDKFYNAKGVDMTKFPTFEFIDPELQAVGLGSEAKITSEPEVVEDVEGMKEEEEEKAYYEI